MHIDVQDQLNLKMGYLRLAGCRVQAGDAALEAELDAVMRAAAARFADASLAEHDTVALVRRLFKASGIDPTRYRPASEALVRRIVKGQGLYRINALVDINNLCSVESLLPLGCYDADRLEGEIHVRIGRTDESYEGIGREINIAGKLVGVDALGPFGSPIADSSRSKITESTRNALLLVYAPCEIEDAAVMRVLDRFAVLAERHVQATPGDRGIAG
ncbi:MAG: phenylalanine--tRNA ligase beta subunit-related protein [Gammaproteobacteria bacterium]|nr:phenylalanine--tRNA ligase beta subunit-related protein [Gammaproteobacteria bacterium]